MAGIFNLIIFKIDNINFSDPVALIDLVLALFFVVSFLLYIRRFPVFRVILGILILFGSAIVFFLSGLILTSMVFGLGSLLIFISLPLIFAPEVRHYLEKLGRFSFFKIPRFTNNQRKVEFIKNLVNSVFELAERNIGAACVIARKTGLGETIETGVIIDARFSSKLLQSIFYDKSPLHDGAVVINGERILAAGCLLPISGAVKLDPPFGTRHKSAIAITQDTDAVVVVVSEQRSEVSLAENGKLHIDLSRAELTDRLSKLL